MKKLDPNFRTIRYGVECRLVNEGDAEFIVAVRNEGKNGDFLHKTGDVNSQIQWIKEYKKREAEDKEYYFIFSKEGKPYGLNRFYNIDWLHLTYTGGSWVCSNGVPYELSMLTSIISGEISIELGLLLDIYEVMKDNLQVIKFHKKIVKAINYGETESDMLFYTTQEIRKLDTLRHLIGIF